MPKIIPLGTIDPTLYGIANAYDVSVAELRTWNRMEDTRLDVGDRLTIRVARSRSAQ